MTKIDDWTGDIHEADAIEAMRAMPASSVHAVICSPPYFGLRDYGDDVESVFGDDPDCDHEWAERARPAQGGESTDENPPDVGANRSTQDTRLRGGGPIASESCRRCGAWRGQLGLEPTLDRYVENLVAIGDAVARVLRPDGSWWLNLGDSYAGSGGAGGQWDTEQSGAVEYSGERGESYNGPLNDSDLRRKNKMLVPYRVAIALQEAGWIVRNDVVWAKPNPMPHPVTDRLNTTTERVFHLVRREQYHYDLDAIREPHAASSIRRASQNGGNPRIDASDNLLHEGGKNPGDVFEEPTKSFAGAHFAVFPPGLIEKPMKATVPEKTCAACGAPYERVREERDLLDRDPEEIDREQAARAREIFESSDLSPEHVEALQSVGLGFGEYGQQTVAGSGENLDATEALAREFSEVLGSYAREFLHKTAVDSRLRPTCACSTEATEPGIVLDPFCGAGTTPLLAKDLGRRFIGVDLSPEYVAMAQERVGIPVDEPELIREEGATGLDTFAGAGGDR